MVAAVRIIVTGHSGRPVIPVAFIYIQIKHPFLCSLLLFFVSHLSSYFDGVCTLFISFLEEFKLAMFNLIQIFLLVVSFSYSSFFRVFFVLFSSDFVIHKATCLPPQR